MTNGVKDKNGNEVPSVSEIRRKFDQKMAVTKLPANESKYGKTSVEQYLNQLKDCENSVGYTKVIQDDKPVPVHLPYEKNGVNGTHKWESSSSKSDSNSDISISKTISEPTSLAKNVEKTNSLTKTDRLASIKNQLDPNNPIGKILEKSTVITVDEYRNGDVKKKEIEKQVRLPHTSNFASYIQISQPIASGSSKAKEDKKANLKYIDSEEEKSILDNDIESPSGTGYENKTFEHENYIKRRTEREEEKEDGVKSMETSTESTFSEDSSPDTPLSRRKNLNAKDVEDIKAVSVHFYLAQTWQRLV